MNVHGWVWMLNTTIAMNIDSRGDGMMYSMYRAEELEAAIEKYVDSLPINGLVDYIKHDLIQAYQGGDNGMIDEFIQMIDVEEIE